MLICSFAKRITKVEGNSRSIVSKTVANSRFILFENNTIHWSQLSIRKECSDEKANNKVKAFFKVAFTRIYTLIVYILLVNKVIYKWSYLYIKT